MERGEQDHVERVGVETEQALQLVALCESERREPIARVAFVELVAQLAEPGAGGATVDARGDNVPEHDDPAHLDHCREANPSCISRQWLTRRQ